MPFGWPRLRAFALLALASTWWFGCPAPGPSSADGGPDGGRPVHTADCLDQDGDGVPGTGACTTVPSPDCDDQDPSRYPNAEEVCDGLDQDCDANVDEGLLVRELYADDDKDGYGAGQASFSCRADLTGFAIAGGDCDDSDQAVNPGATEQCNGRDDDCDGHTDESFPTESQACQSSGLGVCAAGTWRCQGGAPACVSQASPGPETCDGQDEDCDGSVDEAFSDRGSACTAGVGVCERSGTRQCKADGSGTECSAVAGAPTAAACDGQDNDCDGQTDELEPAGWALVAPGYLPAQIETTPFFYSASGCRGGTGTSGTDAFDSHYAALLVQGDVYVQRLQGDGAGLSAPLDLTPFTLNREVAIAQAGDGLVVASLFSSSYLDLYFVQQGPSAATLNGSGYYAAYTAPSGVTLSSARLVRGSGGRVILMWRETGNLGSRIRMARYAFSGSGSARTVTELTSPLDLETSSASEGPFAAASTHLTYGNIQTCSASSARVGLVHRVGASLYFDLFTESGLSASAGEVVYTGSASGTPDAPALAYAKASGADRWGAAFAVRWQSSADASLHTWHSFSGLPTREGAYYAAAGTFSVKTPRVVARSGEFLHSALVHATSASAAEPQVHLARRSHAGASSLALTQVTTAGACSVPNCAQGTRTAHALLSGEAGPLRSAGVALVTGSSGDLSAAAFGCQ